MSDERISSENLLNLAKTDPQAFYDYWRARLTSEEYEQLVSTAWRSYSDPFSRRYVHYEHLRRPLHLKSALDEAKFERIPPPIGLDMTELDIQAHLAPALGVPHNIIAFVDPARNDPPKFFRVPPESLDAPPTAQSDPEPGQPSV